jgi:hypothetical protein
MMKMMKVKVAAMVLAAAMMVTGMATVSYQAALGQEQPPAQNPREPASGSMENLRRIAQSLSSSDSFGPVMNMTINDDGVKEDLAGDLDTGKLFTPSPELRRSGPLAAFNAIAQQEMDLMYESGVSTKALMGIDMAVLPVEDGYFDRAEPVGLMRELSMAKPGTPAIMTNRVVPASYRFRTREGGVGVLEIVKVNTNPSSVEIRYKLLTPAARDAVAAALAAQMILPELDKQLRRLEAGGMDANEAQTASDELAFVLATLREVTRGTPWEARARGAAAVAAVPVGRDLNNSEGGKGSARQGRQALGDTADKIAKAVQEAAGAATP